MFETLTCSVNVTMYVAEEASDLEKEARRESVKTAECEEDRPAVWLDDGNAEAVSVFVLVPTTVAVPLSSAVAVSDSAAVFRDLV